MSNVFQSQIESIEVRENHLAIVWLEQNHFLFKTTSGALIHVDPYLSRTVKPENFIHSQPLVAADEIAADHVLLTHDHGDHTDPDTVGPMSKSNPDCKFYGSEESCARCIDTGIDESRLTRVDAGDGFDIGNFAARAVYAENTGDNDPTTHLGFIIDIDGIVVYITGDTKHDVRRYRHRLTVVENLAPDLMIVPINDGYNNPGPAGANELVELATPRIIVPCHFGCFKHNTIDPDRFVEVLSAEYRNRVRAMERGGSITVARQVN